MTSDLLTQLYNAYKDWCIFNRLNPLSARRLYSSVWEMLRVNTHNTHGRGMLRGIQIIPETTQTGAEGAEAVQV